MASRRQTLLIPIPFPEGALGPGSPCAGHPGTLPPRPRASPTCHRFRGTGTKWRLDPVQRAPKNRCAGKALPKGWRHFFYLALPGMPSSSLHLLVSLRPVMRVNRIRKTHAAALKSRGKRLHRPRWMGFIPQKRTPLAKRKRAGREPIQGRKIDLVPASSRTLHAGSSRIKKLP